MYNMWSNTTKEMDYMKNKRNIIFLSIGAITLIAAVLGATYAFFIAQGGSGSNTGLNVGTNTTDNLSFKIDGAISLTINQNNFSEGAGNQAGSTTASATLTANNATNNATAYYYLYLNISSNNLVYTTEEQTAELILTVKDPSGAAVTELSGYNYVTVGDVSGFDITTKDGLITLADNYEITSTRTNTQEWEVIVTFINLDTDQNANTGKSFSASLIIQEDEIEAPKNLASYITDELYTEDGVNGLYYHDGAGSYTNANQEAGDNSYRFSGGDYLLTEKATSAGYTELYAIASSENNSVINFYCDEMEDIYCLSQNYYYTTAYNETTHYNTLTEALNQAAIDNYLIKDNIKNFVCFGSDETSCPEDNLYRIIGVFGDQVKLIKADYANSNLLGTNGEYVGKYDYFLYSYRGNIPFDSLDSYMWDYRNGEYDGEMCLWENGNLLNTINLNTNYINSIGNTWSNLISTHSWKAGGSYSVLRKSAAQTVYNYEVGVNSDNTLYNAKIGVMYVSDYGYAASPANWNTILDRYDDSMNTNNNWMFMGTEEWTISRDSNITNPGAFESWGINIGGDIYGFYTTMGIGVRPCFYLNENVEFSGGAGTKTDPYRIAL